MFSTLSALIIDGNKVSRKNLTSISRNILGIKDITACESARAAERYFQQSPNIDLMFLDHETLNGDSFAIIDEAKKHIPKHDLKIVLLANGASKSFLLEAAGKGVSCFIVKPYTAKLVSEKIKKLFTSKAQRQSKRLSLFGAVSLTMYWRDQLFDAALMDISSGGCLVKTQGFQRKGVEILDEFVLQIPFDDEFAEIKAQLLRLERDKSEEDVAINAGFAFKEMQRDNALQFAKLWAALLRQIAK